MSGADRYADAVEALRRSVRRRGTPEADVDAEVERELVAFARRVGVPESEIRAACGGDPPATPGPYVCHARPNGEPCMHHNADGGGVGAMGRFCRACGRPKTASDARLVRALAEAGAAPPNRRASRGKP